MITEANAFALASDCTCIFSYSNLHETDTVYIMCTRKLFYCADFALQLTVE